MAKVWSVNFLLKSRQAEKNMRLFRCEGDLFLFELTTYALNRKYLEDLQEFVVHLCVSSRPPIKL